MNKFITFFSFLMLSTFIGKAQNLTINGKIIDADKKEMADVVVSLFKAKDKILVKNVLSETDGSFEFSNLKENDYLLIISNLGFKKYESEIIALNKTLTLPIIVLQTEGQVLQEVTVKSKTPFIERRVDRTIVNVDAQISNAGSNALEVLEKSPGVIVDENGIRLKGRAGVQIFIDDKPTYLSGDQLNSYLKSLPAGTLKQIELMTNPPARYEAAGNAGVINIITKRDKNNGFFGNFQVNYARSRYNRSNNGLNLNYNSKKWSMTGIFGGRLHNSYQDLNINRTYLKADRTTDSYFNQNSYIRKGSLSGNAKIGVDYYASEKTTFGVVVSGLVNPNSNKTDNNANVLDSKQALLRKVVADNKDDGSFANLTYSANLRHQIDSSGQNITFDADYVTYNSDAKQRYINYSYTPQNQLEYQDQLNGALPSKISIYAFKSDYTKPLKNEAKFEAGIKTAFTQTDNTADYTDLKNNITTPNYDLTNQFLYDEFINAAYINFSKNVKKVEMQAGLRGEYTILEGNQLGNAVKAGSDFDNDYFQVFPTFYINYKLDSTGENQVGFNYGRRIDRPNFQSLNPFVSPLDKFTFYSGNPFLQPTFSNNLSLTYSRGQGFTANLGYSYTTNAINETLEIDTTGKYFSRPNNIGRTETISLDFTIVQPIGKKINSNFYLEVGKNKYISQLYTEQLNSSGYYMTGNGNFTFTLPKKWTSELSGQFQTDYVYGQLVLKRYWLMNLAASKKVLNDKGSLKFVLNDVFHTRIGSGTINNLRLTEANWNSQLDTRIAVVNFSYRFGKPSKSRAKHQKSSSEEERQRVRG